MDTALPTSHPRTRGGPHARRQIQAADHPATRYGMWVRAVGAPAHALLNRFAVTGEEDLGHAEGQPLLAQDAEEDGSHQLVRKPGQGRDAVAVRDEHVHAAALRQTAPIRGRVTDHMEHSVGNVRSRRGKVSEKGASPRELIQGDCLTHLYLSSAFPAGTSGLQCTHGPENVRNKSQAQRRGGEAAATVRSVRTLTCLGPRPSPPRLFSVAGSSGTARAHGYTARRSESACNASSTRSSG